ncbi:UDP-N-acetylglucosamine--N-acetylmuramyl-(pentapeptide) pyrophosphoryl-undecaprenol N-acetylglucosamine transferase [Bythopirellula polymerisocia]|uniref:UDP-N-acetylglucosamine--N-acetylmuramyl-(pentapeptide) pyrophosphoryl-undecaprenol N-acetylglucosamine transferase n=1 Tax=Bythopirellula polymerisocia TaxID=2528003 RepID=A0A5C6CQ29_9BACT|nr:UDP-N-acetylglucosamine--N-acetylmuramyl-(pentapeptide) pyrophosphoryl-undecaprenol N-acetylglucosamine transferase [Bythopirellula polymerisocia]TWU25594.1 UDP-N-acetylglucosamine--N-acetylmuramyl-(pentapeptide) pyrophosphoryl-undecaprenol N-acetylglucosamine transferase MurG [Bythopirellula polymerisocia]
MMAASPHIMFAGGGAPGQLFPGIAVASKVAQFMPQAKITFAGPGKCRERHAVRSAGYQYLTIPSKPLPQNPLQALRFVTDNLAGYCTAKWTLREQRVSLVVGLGGHTSTSVVRAAAEKGIPFILLEQNAIPSRTTRWLSRAATMVCAAFEEVRPHLHIQAPVKVTGNPARPAFDQMYQRISASRTEGGDAKTLPFGRLGRDGQRRMVILGGAGGARSLNESMPFALAQLKECLVDWQIVHQTGEGQLQETESRYRKVGVEALAVTYIDEIASVLFASDLAVCRSGGTTLAELALAGVPAVLVPYSHARDDQQLANAKVYVASKTCRLIDESSQAGSLDKALAREITPMLVDENLRKTMSANMRSMARPDASAEIAAAIQVALFGTRGDLLAA